MPKTALRDRLTTAADEIAHRLERPETLDKRVRGANEIVVYRPYLEEIIELLREAANDPEADATKREIGLADRARRELNELLGYASEHRLAMVETCRGLTKMRELAQKATAAREALK